MIENKINLRYCIIKLPVAIIFALRLIKAYMYSELGEVVWAEMAVQLVTVNMYKALVYLPRISFHFNPLILITLTAKISTSVSAAADTTFTVLV